jgi:hypothetical protein
MFFFDCYFRNFKQRRGISCNFYYSFVFNILDKWFVKRSFSLIILPVFDSHPKFKRLNLRLNTDFANTKPSLS